MKKVIIKTSFNVDDFVDFNFFTILSINKMKRMLISIFILGILFIVLGIVPLEEFIIVAIGIGLLIFPFLFIPLFKRNVRKIYKDSPLMNQTSEIEFDDKGFTETTEISKSVISWDKVYLIAENKSFLYIFISKVQAFLINLEDIDEETYQDILDLILKYVPEDKRK